MQTEVKHFPDALTVKMLNFLKDGKTGSITLDVKDGSIQAWKIMESGRVGGTEKIT
jgi:hypothetical protein